jgi:hypothetical protein
LINYLLEQYAIGESAVGFLPISFFEMLIGAATLLFISCSYFIVLLTNRKARKKADASGWEKSAIKIRNYFLAYFIIGGILAILALKTGNIKLILPVALAIYGLFCIRIQNYSNGNTNILGLFFVLQAIMAYLIPEAALIIGGISFGGFHIVYGILLGISHSPQHSPEDS